VSELPVDGLYSKKLFELRKELKKEIDIRKKKKKKFKPNQQIMIDFINGRTKEAIYDINSKRIILKRGDSKKGFQHIIERHYCKDCDGKLGLMDILNFDLYLSRAIKLYKDGVTNDCLDVYFYTKGNKSYKIVLKSLSDESLVVTFYSVK
jgi:hypothetical protein